MKAFDSSTPVLAELDLICENCNKQITIGQDYFYDEKNEEILCEECAKKSENIDI